jgi:hypothetical protein
MTIWSDDTLELVSQNGGVLSLNASGDLELNFPTGNLILDGLPTHTGAGQPTLTTKALYRMSTADANGRYPIYIKV